MAVKIKQKDSSDLLSIVEMMKKKGTNKTAFIAGDPDQYVEIDRIPSGVFAVDYATGGGFPKGKISIIYGVEASGKTNLVYTTINEAQIDDPNMYQVFIDVEDHFDSDWASNFINDMNRLIVIKVDNAEDAIDKMEAVLIASDVNYIALDSLAMLASMNEIESDGGKAAVGGSSNLIGKLFRKLTSRLSQLGQQGKYPAVVLVNQVRHKIGVMFGDPETMPGGNAPKFMSALTLRLYGKDNLDKKDDVVYNRTTSVIIKKKKVPTLTRSAEYVTQVVNGKDGLKAGEFNDWNLVLHTLKSLGLLVKDKKWILFGDADNMFNTLDEVKIHLTSDKNEYSKLKKKIIQIAKETQGL